MHSHICAFLVGVHVTIVDISEGKMLRGTLKKIGGNEWPLKGVTDKLMLHGTWWKVLVKQPVCLTKPWHKMTSSKLFILFCVGKLIYMYSYAYFFFRSLGCALVAQ